MSDNSKKLTKNDYYNAICVQDACNLSGVLTTWAKIMEKINYEARERNEATDWRNSHPINVLFASKVASLTNSEITAKFSEAYGICKDQSEIDE
jgi:hypothetical protein